MIGLLLPLALKWIGARLKEPTTYAGLFTLLAAHFGLTFAPELQGTITQALIAIAAAALIALNGEGTITRAKPAESLPAVPDAPILSPSDPLDNTTDLNKAEVARHGG